jgi:hypothetical protein
MLKSLKFLEYNHRILRKKSHRHKAVNQIE